jgi:hypothetical protein
MPNFKAVFFFLISLFFLLGKANAQEDQKVVQIGGLIVTGDSAYGVPGVHIYVERSGRGTTSNQYGFFSFPTLVGDTLTISAVSYKKRKYIVPDVNSDQITTYIELLQDTIMLPAISIYPWPTEELFKEAFLAMNPTAGEEYLKRGSMNENLLLRMQNAMDMDAGLNYSYYMDNAAAAQGNEYMAPTLSLINPFAWSRFIKSLKARSDN